MGELSIIFFVTYGLAELLLFFVYFEKIINAGEMTISSSTAYITFYVLL